MGLANLSVSLSNGSKQHLFGMGFYRPQDPFCHPINSVKALDKTQSISKN